MKALLIVIAVVAMACNRSKHTIWMGGEEHPAWYDSLRAREGKNPETCLIVKATMKDNLLGQKVFSGSITNNAFIAGFSNVQLTFHFLNSACNELGAHTFNMKEHIIPGKKIGFKIKSFVPDSTAYFECTVKAKPTVVN